MRGSTEDRLLNGKRGILTFAYIMRWDGRWTFAVVEGYESADTYGRIRCAFTEDQEPSERDAQAMIDALEALP